MNYLTITCGCGQLRRYTENDFNSPNFGVCPFCGNSIDPHIIEGMLTVFGAYIDTNTELLQDAYQRDPANLQKTTFNCTFEWGYDEDLIRREVLANTTFEEIKKDMHAQGITDEDGNIIW